MRKKTATMHPFIALLAREEKNKDVFSAIFSFECPIFDPILVQYFIPHNFLLPVISI